MGIILFKLAKPAFKPQILKPHDLSTNHKNLPTKKTQNEGGKTSKTVEISNSNWGEPRKKKSALLSFESWLFRVPGSL